MYFLLELVLVYALHDFHEMGIIFTSKFGKNWVNPIHAGGGGAESAPLRFFLYNPKTSLDIEKKLSDFNCTPLTVILHTLSITIVIRCCHSNLLFSVCHVIFLR